MRNLEVTQEIFRCFGAHDVDGIVALLHPECVIDFYGPEVIPYAGHYEGLTECRGFFDTVLSSVDIHVFDADQFICEGEHVVVVGKLRLTTKRDGREIKSPFVHVIHCQDGKWKHFRDFMNTAVAQEAFRER